MSAHDPTKLAALWLAAKTAEREANQRRVAIEAQIIESLGCPEESSKTHTLDGFKIVTTGKLSYKADLPQLINLAEQLPADRRPIKQVTTLDETGAKWLRANDAASWRLISPSIEIKPMKPAIKIEEI